MSFGFADTASACSHAVPDRIRTAGVSFPDPAAERRAFPTAACAVCVRIPDPGHHTGRKHRVSLGCMSSRSDVADRFVCNRTSLDKGSRDLGIPIELGNGSAGAALEAFAFGASGATPDVSRQDIELFPIPFRKELAFSFSGSRSALTRAIAREPVAQMDLERKRKLASAFMMATFKQVEEKVALGIELFDREERRRGGNAQLGGLVVSGGVASNMYLRQA